MKNKIFNDESIDVVQLILVLTQVTLVIFISYVFSSMSISMILLYAVFYVIISNIIMSGPMHHQVHRKLFVNKKFNIWYEYLITLSTMMPFYAYKCLHLEHHKYCNDKLINGVVSDPTSTYRFGKDGKEESFLSYTIKENFRPLFANKNFKKNNDIKFDSNVNSNKYMQYGFLITLCVINIKFIIFYIFINILSHMLNASLGYCEHHNATDTNDPFRNSVSCYNKIFNLLTFNTGYHQEHHCRPGTHWSKLPTITKYLPENRLTVKYITLLNV